MNKKLLFPILVLPLIFVSCNGGNETSSSSPISSSDSQNVSSSDDYGTFNPSIGDADVNNDEVSRNYEIYPIPHKINYGSSSFVLGEKIDVYFDEFIDEATQNHLYDILYSKDLTINTIDDYKDSKQAVIVSTYKANNPVKDLVDYSSDLFSKNEAYHLSITEDKIIVLGKDTDSCYYGLTTLQYIFRQVNKRISTLEIDDYSDSIYRGFIEGYYGFPWTPAERIDLMEYGSMFKTNIYIYAPKDDAYHSSNWRGLYNEADLLDLKEQVETGIRTKTRFAWSIHPFIHSPITSNNYDSSLQDIKNKFNQLYNIGVRQFVVSGDDVDQSTVDAPMQNRLLNDLSSFLKEKGDCYDLVFVPSSYCYGSEESLGIKLESYFQELCNNLDSSVQIMWTGKLICSSVENGMFEEFMELSGGRKPFMWMNWPVNDYAPQYLLMGKGEVLNKKYKEGEEQLFTGIVTNPMQQPQESKLSIFAIADYCWNINDFDVDQSYKASFKFVEENCTQEFYRLCQHLTNASVFEGKAFEESLEFLPYLESFEDEFMAKDYSSIPELKTLFSNIIKDAEKFLQEASNIALRDSISPWINALRFTSLSAIEYLNSIDPELSAIDKKDAFIKANEYREAIANCKAPILDMITNTDNLKSAKVGKSVLTPLFEIIRDIATDEYYIVTGEMQGITYRGFDGIYQGEIDNIMDGDLDSFVWFENHPHEDAYIKVDLGEITEINILSLLQGNGQNNDCMFGEVHYSTDGRNYNKLGNISGKRTIIENINISARYIKLVNTGTPTWVAIRELLINDYPFSSSVTLDNVSLEANSTITDMIDDELNTYSIFDTVKNGSTWTLDLFKVKEVRQISLLMNKNGYLSNYKLSYSKDGTSFTEIGTYSDMEFDRVFSTPFEARYIRLEALENNSTYVQIKKFSASSIVTPNITFAFSNGAIYTPAHSLPEVKVTQGINYKVTYTCESLGIVGAAAPTVTGYAWAQVVTIEKTNYMEETSEHRWFWYYEPDSVIYEGFNTISEGELKNIVDGDDNTFVWFEGHPQVGAYVRYELDESQDVTTIRVVTGLPTTHGDTLNGYVEYSSDGITWIKAGDLTGEYTTLNVNAEDVKYVRVVNSGTATWVAIREITVS